MASLHLLKVGSGRIEVKVSLTSSIRLSRILSQRGCDGDSELVLPEGRPAHVETRCCSDLLGQAGTFSVFLPKIHTESKQSHVTGPPVFEDDLLCVKR